MHLQEASMPMAGDEDFIAMRNNFKIFNISGRSTIGV
jgi:hypothetical protein